MIKVYNEQTEVQCPPVSFTSIPQIVESIFIEEKKNINQYDVSIIFVSATKIRELNRQFLQQDRITDVLAFPNSKHQWDIYVCLKQAEVQAKEYQQLYFTEIVRLTVHGILHCMGYQDSSDWQRKLMWQRQEKIVKHNFARYQWK